ncbi:hypothetical protein LJC10_00810 [Selenomonadales bacterium OttesenSCG-928-I06]|nr:hypothetical protein [Selenomonadales bacterium OttesenSCG-928-I06]
MFNQYFGQFLFNKGALTADQLYNIFEYKDTINVKLGTLAITSGLMTAAQVDEVLQGQKKEDKLFGQIAIDKGFLTESEVAQLLNAQNNKQVSLTQAIVDRGYLTFAEIEQYLDEFYHQESSSSLASVQLEAIKANDVDIIIKMLISESGLGEKSKWYEQYISFLLRNSIRFLDQNPAINLLASGVTYTKYGFKKAVFWKVSQEFYTEVKFRASLAMKEDVLMELANKFRVRTREDVSATDCAVDAITRLFNMNNQTFLSSVMGIKRDQELQLLSGVSADSQHDEPFMSKNLQIPIHYPFGEVFIFLEDLDD